MLIAYLIFFLYCCIVLLVAALWAHRTKKKYISLLTMPLREAETYKSLFSLEEKYLQLVEQGKLKAYPQISRYLEDVSAFLDKCCWEIDINTIVIKEAHKIQSVSQQKLLDEICSSPKEIQELVFLKNVIALEIIGLQRGGDYIKKLTFRLQCQLLILKILNSILSPYTNVINEITKSKKEAQKVQQIVVFNKKLNECMSL